MFKARYPTRGRRGKHPKPGWAIEAEQRLIGLDISKTTLAEMLDCNYTHLICVMTGSRTSYEVQEKILAKLDELERGAVVGDVSDGV